MVFEPKHTLKLYELRLSLFLLLLIVSMVFSSPELGGAAIIIGFMPFLVWTINLAITAFTQYKISANYVKSSWKALFWNYENKFFLNKSISISVTKGPIQKLFGCGSITLKQNEAKSFSLTDIENPDQVAKILESKIGQ